MPEVLSQPTNAAETSFLIPYYRSQPVYAELVEINQRVSMLHPDVLALLYHFAGNSQGGILEIGPYIGGSTIAMSKGINDLSMSGHILSIEKGGSLEHPQHGSLNIVEDLKRNLQQWKADQNTSLIVGESRDITVIDQVNVHFSGEGLGLLFLDADGKIHLDFAAFSHLIHSGTYIIVDDYYTSGPWAAPAEKVQTTKQVLDSMESEGKIECLGVYGWGTWVGRIN